MDHIVLNSQHIAQNFRTRSTFSGWRQKIYDICNNVSNFNYIHHQQKSRAKRYKVNTRLLSTIPYGSTCLLAFHHFLHYAILPLYHPKFEYYLNTGNSLQDLKMLQEAIDPLGDKSRFQYKAPPSKYVEAALRMKYLVLPKRFSNNPANLLM